MYGRLSIWVRELRAPFLMAVIVPFMIGAVLAVYRYGAFDPLLFLMGLAVVLLVHAGSNLMNDYYDYLSGTDRINENRSPFNGGSTFLVAGELTRQRCVGAGCSFTSWQG